MDFKNDASFFDMNPNTPGMTISRMGWIYGLPDPNPNTPGMTLSRMGWIYGLPDPNPNTPGMTLSRMGWIYGLPEPNPNAPGMTISTPVPRLPRWGAELTATNRTQRERSRLRN